MFGLILKAFAWCLGGLLALIVALVGLAFCALVYWALFVDKNKVYK